MLSRPPRIIWSAYLLLSLLATAGYFALPSAGAQTVAYDLIGLSAVLACVLGIWWHRPIPRAPWILIALGNALAASGDLFWTYDKTVVGIETPFPSPADAIYLGGTALLCVGVLLLAHAYTGGRDHAALIDTASLAIGGGLILWTFVINPQWDNTARPPLDRLVATAYPGIDVLILAAALRAVLGSGGRTVALRLFTAALGLLCASNVAYAVLLAQDRYYPGHPVVAGWLLAYVLSGTLTLHPSIRIPPSAVTSTPTDLSRRRLILLALAALTGPALLAFQAVRHADIDLPVIVAASVALFLLALGRLQLLASALREREARFRALVQRATDGVAIVNADGLALYQSPAVATIIGYTPEELLGRDVFARIHPEDHDVAQQLFRDLLDEPGGTRARDLRVRHADNSWRVLEVRGTNLLAEPAVGGIVINYRDITERASVDAARQASERQLRAQFEGFPLATMTWRRTGDDFVLVNYNAAAIPFSSGRVAKMVGLSCREYNRDRPYVLADFERCYADRATLHRDYTQPVSSTGLPRHFSVTYAFVPPDLVMAHTEDVTERLRAEAALHASERDYRELLEEAADAIFIFEETGRFVRVNAMACALTGHTREELLTLSITDIIPVEEAPKIASRVASLADGTRTRERLVRRKDGAIVPTEVSATRLSDGRVQVIIRDVTERKAAEAALREREAQFRYLFAHNPHPMWVYDKETLAFLEVNDAAVARYGYTRDEFLAMTIVDIRPPEELARLRETLSAYPLPEQISESWHHRLKDGRDIAVDIASRELEYAGQSARLVVAQDVTARIQAEEALRASEERFRLLAENADDVIFRYQLQPTRGFEYVSPASIKLGGYTPEEHYADPDFLLRIIHPDDRAAFLAQFASGSHGDSTMRWIHKDGSVIATEQRVTPIRDEVGRLVAIEGIVRDITARKAAEAALREEERRSRLLSTAAQRQARELELLDRVRGALARELDLRGVFRTTVEAIASTLGHPQVALYLIEGDDLVLQHEVGFSDLPHEVVSRLSLADGICGRVARTGEPVLVENAHVEPDYRSAIAGTGSEVCVPLSDQGKVVGILNVESPVDRPLTRSDLDLMVGISEQVSVAIGRARLYAAVERQARELALLDQVRTAMASELDPGGILRAIVEATAEVFPHTNVALYLLEGDELVLQQITGASNDQYSRLPLGQGIIGRVGLTGQPVLLEDVDTDPAYLRAHPSTVSEVCVPLMDEGRVIGVLNAESADGLRLGADDLRLLVSIGHHTSTALVRARLYAEARASATRLAAAQAIAHLGSWEFDIPTGELRWSDEVFRIGGYPPQAFVPTPERMMTAVHPDDRDLVRRAYQASLEGVPYDVDHRIVRPDGEVRVVHQQAEFVFDASGRAIKRVGVVQDITERRSLEARLRHQAFHDPLTGLPNRALLRDRLGQALVRAGRGEYGTCAVLLLDLDRFKTVNDSLGHAAGDRLLVAATARLRTVLRDGDTLARLGGDEFVVLLEDVVDLAEALRVAERLHAVLDTPLVIEDRAIFATASIGVALRSGPEDGPEDLLRFADVALYRAKEAGRACTEAFYPGMSATTLERLDLEHDLRLALERNELVAHYQPKVDLTTGMVAGLEALVRWRHPERGLVPPGEFIPLAEETGLISPIGRWMLAESCRQLVAWRTQLPGRAAPFVSVNLSARQFRNPDLVAEVAAVLAETGLPPHLLVLEVTETVAMARPEAGVATLRALKALGVHLVLDDFGTGYSSLAYLQQLPVDGLKIDRAFFRPGERNRVIVRAVADLARGLGLDVTAEGLETPEQVAWACEVGCDRGQGYYFSRPVPAEEIEALWALGLTFDLPELVTTSRSPIPTISRRTR